MNRNDIHAKLDKLFDSIEDAADKAEDGFEKLKDKAEDLLEISDDDKHAIKMGAECAADSVQRAACRGKNWLRDKFAQLQMDADDLDDTLSRTKSDLDKNASLGYVKAMEKYAEDMLKIAQETADEAADAVQKALAKRKEHEDKFGK